MGDIFPKVYESMRLFGNLADCLDAKCSGGIRSPPTCENTLFAVLVSETVNPNAGHHGRGDD